MTRVQVSGRALKELITFFEQHPELRYVSDGDPDTVSAPLILAPELGEPMVPAGLRVDRY
jgi:hypothetical protein